MNKGKPTKKQKDEQEEKEEKERRNQEEKKILEEEFEKYKKSIENSDSESESEKICKCKKECKRKNKRKYSESEESESEEEEEEEEEEKDEEKEEEKKDMLITSNKINEKCSLNEHKEIEAIIFCQECNIFMCNKCEKLHSGLFKNHHQYNINQNNNQIFTGLCMKKNHSKKLEYLCKTHNQLCCVACIAKIKARGYGQHKYCRVCFLKKAKNKKMKNLKKNIDFLNDLSKNIENSINQLKAIFEKINNNKEELKLKIQKIFTNLRNALNNREDELLEEIESQYNELF